MHASKFARKTIKKNINGKNSRCIYANIRRQKKNNTDIKINDEIEVFNKKHQSKNIDIR